MRVVVPYVDGMLHLQTCEAVRAGAPRSEFVRLDPADDAAYARLLCGLWAAREDFAIVEHDVVPPDGWLAEIEACAGLWCLRGPLGRPGLDWLGCVRFRAEVMEAHPDLMAEALSISDDGDVAWTWRKGDVRLARVLRHARVVPCFHSPQCAHLHSPRTPQSA